MLAIYLEFGRVIQVDYIYQFYSSHRNTGNWFTRIKIEIKFEWVTGEKTKDIDSCQMAVQDGPFHDGVPRGQQIHRKWVWQDSYNVSPSWGRGQSGDAIDEPWVPKTPN